MKRSKKSNRVSWAQGVNLCQVKLFLTVDCPNKVGTQAQDNQMKSLTLQHCKDNEPDDLPPGFEHKYHVTPLKRDLSYIPTIVWKRPPKLVMNYNCHVVAGEESQEVESQKQRELNVFEALYPRPSAIPSCPYVSSSLEDDYDDGNTPIIPLIPIEEDEAADAPAYSTAPLNASISSQPPALPQVFSTTGIQSISKHNTPALEAHVGGKTALGPLSDPGADLIASASAAVTAVMKSKEHRNLIDTDLLIKILRDPKMVEELINNTNTNSAEIGVSEPVTRTILPSTSVPAMLLHHDPSEGQPTVSITPAEPKPFPVAPSIPTSRPGVSNVQPTGPAPGNLYTQPSQVQPTSSSVPSKVSAVTNSSFMTMKQSPAPGLPLPSSGLMPAQPINVPQSSVSAIKPNLLKDENYIKNLIREHGFEKQEMPYQSMAQNGTHHHNHIQNSELNQNKRLREVAAKFQKPCLYFRSARGCRNGSNCPYRHDLSYTLQIGATLETPSAKRMKLNAAIMGRT